MAILNPASTGPRTWLAGTRTPSKNTAAVGCEFHPIFFSCAPNERPGAPFSTMRHEMPAGPGPPVRAMTRYTSARPPPEMKALDPSMT